MKKNTYYLITLCFVMLSFVKVFANDSLQINAEKFYAEKNYKKSIEYYKKILKEGYTSYKLHYNLGNAYYKNNQIGMAIYQYELANKIEPNNKDIQNNLRIANEKTIDKIESKENFFIGVIKSGIVNFCSTTQWAWISIISLIVCLALVFIFILSKQLLVKRISFFISTLSLIVFISSMVIGFSALKQQTKNSFGIITDRETKIQDEPTTSSSSKFSLHEGTKIKVIETTTEWTNIKLENGNEGWVKTSSLGLL